MSGTSLGAAALPLATMERRLRHLHGGSGIGGIAIGADLLGERMGDRRAANDDPDVAEVSRPDRVDGPRGTGQSPRGMGDKGPRNVAPGSRLTVGARRADRGRCDDAPSRTALRRAANGPSARGERLYRCRLTAVSVRPRAGGDDARRRGPRSTFVTDSS